MRGSTLAPFNWWAFLGDEGNLFVQSITALFDLILLLMLPTLFYRVGQRLKYSRAHLAFERFPFAPGEPLRMYLSPNRFGELEVTLRFVEEWFEHSPHGSNRTVHHRSAEHWSERQTLSPRESAAEVEIEFNLPENPEWVDQLTADPRIRYWELVVEASEPGIDYRATFPLPVYDRDHVPATINPPRRPTRANRRPFPYAFEIGLPLALFGLLATAWMIAPQPMDRALQTLLGVGDRARLTLALRPLTPGHRDPMALAQSDDGAVWVLTKYGLDRYGADGREALLDTHGFRGRFGLPLDAPSALHVSGPDEAWVGSWHGELLHYRAGEWRRASPRDEPLQGRIRALRRHHGALYVSGRDGLWSWSESGGMTPIEGVGKGTAHALAHHPDGALLAAVGSDLWRLDGDGWRKVWGSGERRRPITALLAEPDGTLHLGTDHGLVTLGANGRVTADDPNGPRITALAMGDQGLWIGRWKEGVRWHSGGDSFNLAGLPGDQVTALLEDRDGRLWVALYGTGVSRAPGRSLIDALQ